MDGPEQNPQSVPWACRISWLTQDKTTIISGSGFLLDGHTVITARHVLPEYVPPKITVDCGGQERAPSSWGLMRPQPKQPEFYYAAKPIKLIGPWTGDFGVVLFNDPFDGPPDGAPRLPRSTREADALVDSGRCAAFGWAGGSLHGQKVTAVENDRSGEVPGNPQIGPPAWHSGAMDIVQYPGPAEHGDSGGPVVCRDASGGLVLVALNESLTSGHGTVYERVAPYLDFFCGMDPDYCAREGIHPAARGRVDSSKLGAVLGAAKASAGGWNSP